MFVRLFKRRQFKESSLLQDHQSATAAALLAADWLSDEPITLTWVKWPSRVFDTCVTMLIGFEIKTVKPISRWMHQIGCIVALIDFKIEKPTKLITWDLNLLFLCCQNRKKMIHIKILAVYQRIHKVILLMLHDSAIVWADVSVDLEDSATILLHRIS